MPRARTQKTKADPLDRVSGRLPLDADALRARVESVLAEVPFWFPVRHHSPAVALHLERALLARKPRLIFLEAPSQPNDLPPPLTAPQPPPPVAIYCSYRDDDNVL